MMYKYMEPQGPNAASAKRYKGERPLSDNNWVTTSRLGQTISDMGWAKLWTRQRIEGTLSGCASSHNEHARGHLHDTGCHSAQTEPQATLQTKRTD